LFIDLFLFNKLIWAAKVGEKLHEKGIKSHHQVKKSIIPVFSSVIAEIPMGLSSFWVSPAC
jgi:hypothetical protein